MSHANEKTAVQGTHVCAVGGMSMGVTIDIPTDKIAEFCKRWQIKELAIFGSTLREDLRPDSDVDVLVVFEDHAPWGLFDLMHAEEELEHIFGRKVDLVEKKTIRNPFRRQHILTHHEVIYAS
jgi:predicted nucleotidyltransferase